MLPDVTLAEVRLAYYNNACLSAERTRLCS